MLSIEHLRSRLKEGDIPIETWGLPGTATKTVEDLFREIQEGSAFISPSGPVSCSRHSVCVEITHASFWPSEGVLRLHEAWQRFPDGAVLERNLPCLRETSQPPETFAETAARGIREELGLEVDPSLIVSPNIITLQSAEIPRKLSYTHYVSKVYPGLSTWRTESHVFYNMPLHQFRKEGYELSEHGITIFFEWRTIEEQRTPPARL